MPEMLPGEVDNLRDVLAAEPHAGSPFHPRQTTMPNQLVMQTSGSNSASDSPIGRSPDENSRKDAVEAGPLSFAQQRLWFLDQLEGKSPLYNVPLAVRIIGPVEEQALKSALDQIIARHESLRTNFLSRNGTAVQVVHPQRELKLDIVDLRETADSRTKLSQVLQELARRPFDLEQDLLIRAAVVQLSSVERILFLNLHHIICDEWSLRILLRELAQCYNAFLQNRPLSLAEPPIQYADYAAWQREWLQGPVLGEQLEYWRDRLSRQAPLLEWPWSEASSKGLSRHLGARQSRLLPEELSRALLELSRRERVTLFMIALASFKALLYRYTGQEDITIGSPIAGRTRVETEELIGFFVNTLVLRTDLSGDPSFIELLRRVRETTLGAYDHQDVPFEKLVQELHPERTSAQMPFLQVMFAFEQQPPDDFKIEGVQLEVFEVETGTAKFDLTCVIREATGGLELCVEYAAALFDEGTVSRLLGDWQVLLEGFIANPNQKLSQAPLLTPQEYSRSVIEWNQTGRPYPADASIPALFEEQAMKLPDALALKFNSRELTYGELNRRADRLAQILRNLGVGTDVLVGLCAEGSIELIVGMLGILKAGGAYVPLDPNYPQERLGFILDDTKAPVVLVQEKFRSVLPSAGAKVLCLETIPATGTPEVSRTLQIHPENLAYVIYTSGSTGRPKGVLVPHRAVVRLVRNSDYVQLSPADRVAQASNVAFDAATFEIWGALLNGAALIGIGRDVALSSQALSAALAAERVTTLFLTTALFNQIAAEAPEAFSKLEQLLFGGEAVEPKWVARVLEHRPPKRLLHVYGPTETTTFASWHLVANVPAGATTIPIGRPIANTSLYILDRSLQPVPIGVPGELYVGGPGVARGYLNAPDLTAARFVPDPFSQAPGARLYRTGDRVRSRADGNIEFLGRFDNQVKIRGFRVELGEVEAVLKAHPAVREAVVVARDSAEARGKSLAAYFVLKTPEAPGQLKAVRQFLKEKLPHYMIPANLIPLKALPLNANGKVDRKALLATDSDSSEVTNAFVAPRRGPEERLAAIWSDLLGLPRVSVRDNFFDLGGHSLLAVRLFAEIEKQFGKKLPLATLFRSPTVEQLAELISIEETGSPWPLVVDIQPHGTKPPFFWMHSLGGDGGGAFFYYRKLAQLLGPEQPSFGIRSPQEPFTRIEEMAAHYINELLRVQPNGPYFLGGFCFGGIVAFEMARQLHTRGREVALLVLLESAPPRGKGVSVRWGPGAVASLGRNLQSWIADLAAQGPEELWQRLHRKGRAIQGKIQRYFTTSETTTDTSDISEVINMEEYPKDYVPYARAHWQALRAYQPGCYPGRITLFRARKQPLLSVDPTLGWSDLARAGVAVNVIPGTHEKMLEEPNVHILATELKACLAEAQAGVLVPGDPGTALPAEDAESPVATACSCSVIT